MSDMEYSSDNECYEDYYNLGNLINVVFALRIINNKIVIIQCGVNFIKHTHTQKQH